MLPHDWSAPADQISNSPHAHAYRCCKFAVQSLCPHRVVSFPRPLLFSSWECVEHRGPQTDRQTSASCSLIVVVVVLVVAVCPSSTIVLAEGRPSLISLRRVPPPPARVYSASPCLLLRTRPPAPSAASLFILLPEPASVCGEQPWCYCFWRASSSSRLAICTPPAPLLGQARRTSLGLLSLCRLPPPVGSFPCAAAAYYLVHPPFFLVT